MEAKKLTFRAVKKNAKTRSKILEQLEQTQKSFMGARHENCIISILDVSHGRRGGEGSRTVEKISSK